MSINVRRGLLEDFDPGKMTAGEWAVSIDPESENQIVWMCFAPGIVKRMGTYEDFRAQIAEITGDIINQFKQELTAAQAQLQNKTETYIQGKVDDEWVPELQALVTQAQTSEKNAADSASAAKKSEDASKTAQAGAEKAKTDAETAQKASESARDETNTAKEGAETAKAGADASKTAAATSASESENWRKWSESYAHGNTGVREGEDTDNAEYWYQQAKQISQGLSGIVNMGNVKFAQLDTVEKEVNYMYNVEDEFTSDNTFNDGGNVHYGAGSNVVWTGDEKWDVLAPVSVSGVKGENETYFRQGNVILTKDNIGLSNVENTKDIEKNVKHALSADSATTATTANTATTAGTATSATTATSAGKLTTARDIEISGDAVGKVNFDGTKNVAIGVIRRGCMAGQFTDTAGTNTWYKFASVNMDGSAFRDADITFLVALSYSAASTKCGILTAHVRTGSRIGLFESAELVWKLAASGINPNDFRMAYSTASPFTYELWVNAITSHAAYRFDVLSEGSRKERKKDLWTLYNNVTAVGQSAPTAGYTQINSTLGAIANQGQQMPITYTSADVEDADASAWTKISKITTGMKLSDLFNRVSTMFKNIRYLYKMLGTTNISKIGNGTVTGGLAELNGKYEYSDAWYRWISHGMVHLCTKQTINITTAYSDSTKVYFQQISVSIPKDFQPSVSVDLVNVVATTQSPGTFNISIRSVAKDLINFYVHGMNTVKDYSLTFCMQVEFPESV